MVRIQAEHHALIESGRFEFRDEYVLHLMHEVPYRRVAQAAAGKRVLDLGCNTGYGSAILSEVAENVAAVDVSEKAIAIAKTRYGSRGIDFRRVDGASLPFDDGAFDIVISCQVIEHIVDYDVYVNAIRRVLRDDGAVVFTTPNRCVRLDEGMKPWNELHVREFDALELSDLLHRYFPHVGVAGLFATERTYNVEYQRVQRELGRARNPASGKASTQNFVGAVAKILPRPVVGALKRMVTGDRRSAFLTEHSVQDFFYCDSGMETAIDLAAVCGATSASCAAMATTCFHSTD